MIHNFEICRDLSKEVYKDNMSEEINGWKLISHHEFYGKINQLKGQNPKVNVFKNVDFACVAFGKGDEIIIAYRGTDGKIIDIITDAHFIVKKIPPSTILATKFYQKIKKHFPKAKIWVTGHSLGGAYAQIVSVRAIKKGDDCNAVTFNAPGFGYILSKKEKEKFKTRLQRNISNYVIMNDFIGNFREHAGSTYYIQPFPLNIPNTEKPNCNISPHSAITTYCEKINGKIISCPEGWNSKCAWALWIYDTNPVSKSEKLLQDMLDARTNYNHLKKTINIIEQLKNDKKLVLLNSFNFKCRKQRLNIQANA